MSARFSVYFLRKGPLPIAPQGLEADLFRRLESQATGTWFSLPMIHDSPDLESTETRFYSTRIGEAMLVAVQENVGLFHYEHWQGERLLRMLTYNNDGGWFRVEGEPEEWEKSILFPEKQRDSLLKCYDAESHETINRLYDTKTIREGDMFPSIDGAEVFGDFTKFFQFSVSET